MAFSLSQSSKDNSFRISDNDSGNTNLIVHSDTRVLSFKVGVITRSDTSDTTLFGLRAGAIPVFHYLLGTTESNAGTTATVSVGYTSHDTYFVSAQDVKATNGIMTCASTTNMGAAISTSAAESIVAKYAESGTASTTGGPWTYVLAYYVP